MKISKLFHWLYCLLMFLPVLFIPIMAIYSHRHIIDDYQVTSDKFEVVNFNQINSDEDFSSWTTFYTSYDGANELVLCDASVGDYARSYTYFPLIIGHTYYTSVNALSSDVSSFVFGYNFTLLSITSNLTKFSYTFIPNYTPTQIFIGFPVFSDVGDSIYCYGLQLIDLTLMFGFGNEPTSEQFDIWYPNDFYSYTTSKKELLNVGTETFNYTDIGSQFVYDTYNVVDKYFNYDKVFNFGDLYGWLQLNFFNGNAPLGFFIFWHLLIYWLLTSLLWLIFDILMYVPQLCHRWLDKASLE